MEIEFKKISDFDRGILYQLLFDAYSFDTRCAECWNVDWKEFDDFFYDNLEIADRCGFITTLEGKPIGHISWDPRNVPEYVEIGHNCIAAKYKGKGYGKKQLQEAISRISTNKELNKIIVGTNSKLAAAPGNYESVGFKLCKTRKNNTNTAFSGDYLDYEICL